MLLKELLEYPSCKTLKVPEINFLKKTYQRNDISKFKPLVMLTIGKKRPLTI